MPLRFAIALVALAVPAAPRAHGVLGEVERRGNRFAVRALYEGGAPLAGAAYEVLRPDPPESFQVGRTDAQGWVEFVPDIPGTWRVRIVDASGHGRVVTVAARDVSPIGRADSAPRRFEGPTAPSPTRATELLGAPEAARRTGVPPRSRILRTAVGTLAIALAFALVRVLHRRRGDGR